MTPNKEPKLKVGDKIEVQGDIHLTSFSPGHWIVLTAYNRRTKPYYTFFKIGSRQYVSHSIPAVDAWLGNRIKLEPDLDVPNGEPGRNILDEPLY